MPARIHAARRCYGNARGEREETCVANRSSCLRSAHEACGAVHSYVGSISLTWHRTRHRHPCGFTRQHTCAPMASHRRSGARRCSRIHVIDHTHVSSAAPSVRAAVPASRDPGREDRWAKRSVRFHTPQAARGAVYGYVCSISLMLHRLRHRYAPLSPRPDAPGAQWLREAMREHRIASMQG
jgi:hypothetical protein